MATFLPFNFNPDNVTTLAAESYSYTVPSGYYAIITYCLSVEAKGYWATDGNTTGSANSSTGTIYLTAGDAVTRSVSAASGSGTGTSFSAASSASISVNGSVIASISAGTNGGVGSSSSYSYSGGAGAEASISEYLIP